MIFKVAKKDNKCCGCEAIIERDQEMVLTFMKKQDYTMVLTYHATCYIPWYERMFQKKYQDWKMGGTGYSRIHLGRPVLDDKPDLAKQVHRLIADRSYHIRKGHLDKVVKITKKIEDLKRPSVLQSNIASTILTPEVEEVETFDMEDSDG